MAHAAEHKMRWTLGKLYRRPDGGADLRQFRPVSDNEAEQLEADSRLVRELGSQHDFQSLVHTVERWLQTVERIRERLTAGEAIPKSVVISAGLDLGAWVTMPAERRFGPFQGIKSSAAIARMAANGSQSLDNETEYY